MMAHGSRRTPRRGRVRRRATPPVQRSSARIRFSPRRALAALVMVATAAAIYGVAASPAFALRTVDIGGTALTGTGEVRDALGYGASDLAPDGTVADGPNLFRLATGPLADRIRALPAVADASIAAALPDGIRVTVVEREPILVWADGDRRLLVDRDGLVIGDAAAVDATDAAARAASGLPTIADLREAAGSLAIGSTLDPLDLDVATRLASLTPADVGSRVAAFDVTVDDRDGWMISVKSGWEAVFGFYTPTVRRADLVPAQVRLLRSLLAGRERDVKRAILADGEAGTFVGK
jgi:hypothetical protein